jgi:hypothetical protein
MDDPAVRADAGAKAEPVVATVPGNSSLKDSCTYALDLIKQFLTFTAGGIAFVLGVVSTGKPSGFSPLFVALSIGLLALSGACGLLSFMCIVGNIKDQQSYNIDDPSVKCLTILQILLFCGGVSVLFFPTFQTAKGQQAALSPPTAPSPAHP